MIVQHSSIVWLRRAFTGAACVMLMACSGNGPSVVVDTPSGAMPIYTPAAAAPTDPLAMPPGLAGNVSVPTQPVSRNGTYAGTAMPLDTFGGACVNTMRVEGFHVRGNSVHFGQYRGTIDANNGLQMVYRGTWIVGQFEGDNFQGQVDSMGRFAPGCTYSMTLQRVGP